LFQAVGSWLIIEIELIFHFPFSILLTGDEEFVVLVVGFQLKASDGLAWSVQRCKRPWRPVVCGTTPNGFVIAMALWPREW